MLVNDPPIHENLPSRQGQGPCDLKVYGNAPRPARLLRLTNVPKQGVFHLCMVEHVRGAVPRAVGNHETPVEGPTLPVGQIHGFVESPDISGISVDTLSVGVSNGKLGHLSVVGADIDGDGLGKVSLDTFVVAEFVRKAAKTQAKPQIPA